MRVRVRVFARLRELAGRDHWECDVPTGASVADLWRQVSHEHEALAPYGATVSCAVNTAFARKSATLQDGDEVAFLPPVSGG